MGKKIMVNIEQSKLDEMDNHIAELHTIISYHFDELPYKVQRKLGGYLWSNYEQQQKEREIIDDCFD
jgi:hypothetical protein